jgi:hypothetical protein
MRKINNNQMVGIIDKDTESFSEITNNSGQNIYRSHKYKNLFVTETNDIETYILHNCGLCIFLYLFSECPSDFDKKNLLFDQILNKSELLYCVFKACDNGLLRFKQIDALSIEELSIALNKKHPTCEIFKILMGDIRNQQKIGRNPKIIRQFIQRFNDEKQKPSPRYTENFLLHCRGHSIMCVLCSHSSKWIKDLFDNNARKSEEILSQKIYEIFRYQNSVTESKLYASLSNWEQQNGVKFLKKLAPLVSS